MQASLSNLKETLQESWKFGKQLIFSPQCEMCREPLYENERFFCSDCFENLELLNPEYRCRICFQELDEEPENPCHPRCADCCSHSPILTNISAFTYQGAAKLLVKSLKYGGKAELAEGAASFMTLQWLQLNLPLPDLLISIPLSPLHHWNRGFNQSQLLAEAVGKNFGRPHIHALTKKFSWVEKRQAEKQRSERLELPSDVFSLSVDPKVLFNKNLLLIDDVYTTGTTLKRAGEILLTGKPRSLRALTLCR